MSADFSILGGLAVVVAGVALAPVALAGYAVYKGAEAGARYLQEQRRREEEDRKVRERLEQQRRESYYSTMMDIRAQYQQAEQNFEVRAQQLREATVRTMSEISEGFSEQLSSAGSFRNIEAWVQRQDQTRSAEWRHQHEVLERQFDAELRNSFSSISEKLEQTRGSLEVVREATRDDTRLQGYAQIALEQARAVTGLLLAETGNVPATLTNALNDGQRYYEEQDYNMAYSKASGTILAGLEELEKMRALKTQYDYLADQISEKLYTLQDRMAAAKSLRFTWEGEVVEEDLSLYEPNLFHGLLIQIQDLQARFEGIHFDRGAVANLRQLLSTCEETDRDIMSVCKFAAAKMVFAYSENNNAEIIADVMEEQGFELLDSAYQQDLEGNPLHINFRNQTTGEKLTVVLTPQTNGVQISVHNYGIDGEAEGSIRTQRAVQNALETKLGRRGTCSNLGGQSANTAASDLGNIKVTQAEPTVARNYASRL